jgi:hypothetical protein
MLKGLRRSASFLAVNSKCQVSIFNMWVNILQSFKDLHRKLLCKELITQNRQSSKWKFEFHIQIYFYIVLNKNWKIYWSEQSFTGLGPEDRCSSWGQNKVLLVLGQRTGVHHEDRTKFYWSWARGPVFIMRTVYVPSTENVFENW